MIKRGLLLLIFFLLFSDFIYAQQIEQNYIVKVVDMLTIGDSEPDAEYIFGELGNVFTDSEGSIYVTDTKALAIWVFDENGNYQNKIGRRGRGPGEFLDFSHTFINGEDEIFVPDPHQFRITKFNNRGEVLNTYATSMAQDINFFRDVIPKNNNTFIVLYHKPGRGQFAQYAREGLFHVWDSTFQNELEAYGSFEDIDHTNPFGRRYMETGVGTMVEISNGDLLFAPSLYDGSIYHYKKNGNGWAFNDKIKGFKPAQPSSVSLSENDSNVHSITSYQQETVYGRVNILSSGIFTLNDRYIVHFNLRRLANDHKDWTFGVELFDMNFNYINYFPLKEIEPKSLINKHQVKWRDDKGRFFILTEEEGVPVVKAFTLNVQEE